MCVVLLIFATLWTLVEISVNTRWIEYGIADPLDVIRAPIIIELLAFIWDILIEIIAAYLPYLAIPYLLNIIKTDKK